MQTFFCSVYLYLGTSPRRLARGYAADNVDEKAFAGAGGGGVESKRNIAQIGACKEPKADIATASSVSVLKGNVERNSLLLCSGRRRHI